MAGGRLRRPLLRCIAESNYLVGSAFQIHLLRLSDGRPHPLAAVDQTAFHIDYGQQKAITKLTVLISEHRLVLVVAIRKDLRKKDDGILIWDWRSGHKILVGAFTPARRLMN